MEKPETNSCRAAADEARLLALRIRMEAARCKCLAMLIHDEQAMRTGAGCYTEDSYDALVKALEELADEAEKISKEGHGNEPC